MLKKKDEVDLAICLDQLSSTMAVASHIWTLSSEEQLKSTYDIVYHLCSCYISWDRSSKLSVLTHSEDVSIMVGELPLTLLHPLLPVTGIPDNQRKASEIFKY